MSNNDFDGPYRPAGGRGADDNSGGTRGASGAGGARYPDPEGWGDDGFWRDSSMDSDYETGLNQAIRTNGNGPRGSGGYSYWADGKGWENSPGNGTAGNGSAGNGSAGNGAAANAGRVRGQHRRNGNGANGNGANGNGANGNWNNGNGANGNGRNGAGSPTRADPFGTRMDSYATRADQSAAGGFGTGAEATAFYGGAAAPDPGQGGPGRGMAGFREGWRNPITGPWRTGRGTRDGDPGGPGGPVGPGGPGRGKIKGSWWRHWSWKKALALVGSAFFVFLLLVVGAYYYVYNTTQVPTRGVADLSWQNSTVYYSDGKTPIGTFGTIHRQVLDLSQIPKRVQDAVMAAEDRNFLTEGGISPTGIVRAAFEDVFGNGSLQGGSTITQQFVRNYYQDIGTAQTTSRKIKEIFVAMKLSKEKSKQWILANYLNMIYLGTGAYGVGAAAQTYFHEPVGKLTVAQAAVIAAIIQQPNNYPQQQYRPELIARWHYVLTGMVSMGDLTAQQAATMKFPKMFDTPEQSYGPDIWDPYIMNVVQNELTGVDNIPLNKLQTGGYKIVTTLSRSMTAALYKSVDENVKLIHTEGFKLPSYAMIGAELQNPATGAIVAMYPGRGQNMSAKQCKIYDCDLNTAVYAREQVGSSFKPFVLSAAVNEHMNVATSVLNASPQLWVPKDFPPYNMMLSATSAAKAMPGAYPVHNDGFETIAGSKAGGATSVQNALAQSSNTAFTDLAHRVGTGNIVAMAGNMGVNLNPYSQGGSGLPGYKGEVGMALGIAPMTVNEQTSMLSTIDDNGLYHSAHIIESYQAPGGPMVAGKVSTFQALSPALDSQVQFAMEATTVDGTGTAAAMTDGRPIIGKTGTTTQSKSAFFLGGIKQYSLAVGIFTQSQNDASPQTLTTLGGGGFGGTWPAAIWHTFAEMEFAKLPIEQFQQPQFSGAKWVQVAPQPKKKKKKPKKPVCKFRFGCPTQPPGHGHHHGPGPSTSPSATPSPSNTQPSGGPSPTGSPTGSPSSSPSTSPSGSGTPSGSGPPSSPPPTQPTVGGGGQAGLALGGILSVLPGSLLWTRVARRRRRRRIGGAR